MMIVTATKNAPEIVLSLLSFCSSASIDSTSAKIARTIPEIVVAVNELFTMIGVSSLKQRMKEIIPIINAAVALSTDNNLNFVIF